MSNVKSPDNITYVSQKVNTQETTLLNIYHCLYEGTKYGKYLLK